MWFIPPSTLDITVGQLKVPQLPEVSSLRGLKCKMLYVEMVSYISIQRGSTWFSSYHCFCALFVLYLKLCVCIYVCTCACACACVCVCLCSKLYSSLPRLLEGKESMAKSKVQTLLDHTLSTATDLNSHLYTLHRMDS